MIHQITINELMGMKDTIPLVDVRTPAEFDHGHVPGAYSLPLFSNEERVSVGTTYRQSGRDGDIIGI